MSGALERRCALLMLAATGMATLAGLLAWGPVTLQPEAMRYADSRGWLGIPNAMNVLSNLPVLVVGAWGWHSTSRSTWPAHLIRPWRAFHATVMVAGALSATYHASPNVPLFLLSQAALAAAFTLLCCGALAERVDARMGSQRTVTLAMVVVAVMTCHMIVAAWVTDELDLRPVLCLQLLPVLLIPAGAMSLSGSVTRLSDWLLMLAAYALARLFEHADQAVFDATGGWLGGHALLHLCLALAAACLAYRAQSLRHSAEPVGDGLTQRQTSLKTAG